MSTKPQNSIRFINTDLLEFSNEDEYDYKSPLSLDSYFIDQPESTFFMRAEGDDMEDVGIFSGDVLVVDRSKVPAVGSVIVAVIDGEMKLKHFEERNTHVWGVVTSVIHSLT